MLLDQLSRVLPPDDSFPDRVALVNSGDPQGTLLASRLQEMRTSGVRVITTLGQADVRAAVTCLISKIQKL